MRPTTKRLCFPFAIAPLLAACVSTQVVRLVTAETRDPVLPGRVIVYQTAEQVPRKFVQVAVLTVEGAYQSSNEAMYQSLRVKAGKLGANGIIVQSMPKEHGAGAKAAVSILQAVATVIVGFGSPQNTMPTGPGRKGNVIAIYVFPDSTVAR